MTTQLEPSTWATPQAPDPPVGLLDVTTLPTMSTATQRLLLGQETAERKLPSTWLTSQSAPALAGLFDVTTLPLPSTATQRSTVGHDTPVRKHAAGFDGDTAQLEPSTWVTVHAVDPAVGLLDVTTFPT